MGTTLLFVVAFVIVALLVYMVRYSGRLRVAEKRLIDAPLADVYAKVVDLRAWGEWAPWLEHEPQASVKISGAPDAKGGAYCWEGSWIGAGEFEHRNLVQQAGIEQKMRSLRPFRFQGKVVWQFAERDGQTEVIWSMRGRVGFSLRAFAQTVQGMIALDFRYGLDRLAALLESDDSPGAARHYSITYLGMRDIDPVRYVCRSYQGPLNGIGAAALDSFAEIRESLSAAGAQTCGLPIAVYVKTNIKLRTTVCYFGIPVGETASDELPEREMPAHRAYVVRLTGTRQALEIAWYQAMQRLRVENLQPDQRIPPFECYLTDAASLPEQEWLTELHIAVREERSA